MRAEWGRLMDVVAVDVGLLPLALVGIALVAFGALQLWKAERLFAFYASFNEGKGPFPLPGGASEGATRPLRSPPHCDRNHGVHQCLHVIPQATRRQP
jgi:hypothetical protein